MLEVPIDTGQIEVLQDCIQSPLDLVSLTFAVFHCLLDSSYTTAHGPGEFEAYSALDLAVPIKSDHSPECMYGWASISSFFRINLLSSSGRPTLCVLSIGPQNLHLVPVSVLHSTCVISMHFAYLHASLLSNFPLRCPLYESNACLSTYRLNSSCSWLVVLKISEQKKRNEQMLGQLNKQCNEQFSQ